MSEVKKLKAKIKELKSELMLSRIDVGTGRLFIDLAEFRLLIDKGRLKEAKVLYLKIIEDFKSTLCTIKEAEKLEK